MILLVILVSIAGVQCFSNVNAYLIGTFSTQSSRQLNTVRLATTPNCALTTHQTTYQTIQTKETSKKKALERHTNGMCCLKKYWNTASERANAPCPGRSPS